MEKQLGAIKKSGLGFSADTPRALRSPAGEASTEGGDAGGVSPDSGGEAASAILRLTERNQALQGEVEEEKAEVKRRCSRLECRFVRLCHVSVLDLSIKSLGINYLILMCAIPTRIPFL